MRKHEEHIHGAASGCPDKQGKLGCSLPLYTTLSPAASHATASGSLSALTLVQ
jgi:hypothetical protein